MGTNKCVQLQRRMSTPRTTPLSRLPVASIWLSCKSRATSSEPTVLLVAFPTHLRTSFGSSVGPITLASSESLAFLFSPLIAQRFQQAIARPVRRRVTSTPCLGTATLRVQSREEIKCKAIRPPRCNMYVPFLLYVFVGVEQLPQVQQQWVSPKACQVCGWLLSSSVD
jgi:hypothetical protein